MPARCIESNCNITASFNFKGVKGNLYCALHKKDGMIGTRSKKTCIEPNCKTYPTHNTIGETNAVYCGTHKKDGMINSVYCLQCLSR